MIARTPPRHLVRYGVAAHCDGVLESSCMYTASWHRPWAYPAPPPSHMLRGPPRHWTAWTQAAGDTPKLSTETGDHDQLCRPTSTDAQR